MFLDRIFKLTNHHWKGDIGILQVEDPKSKSYITNNL